jgi:hypothetical protein
LEVAECWADGKASRQELKAAHAAAWRAWGTPAQTAASDASVEVCELGDAAKAANHAAWASSEPTRAAECKAQAALLRCIIGNPFHPVPSLPPSLVAWNGGVVLKLARVMYDEHRFSDMPLLADALEEVGCDDADILVHCRGPGPHVLGCWVLELLLAKE